MLTKNKRLIFSILLLNLLLLSINTYSQEDEILDEDSIYTECEETTNKKALKLFDKSRKERKNGNYDKATQYLQEATDLEPAYYEAFYEIGVINIKNQYKGRSLSLARESFLKVIELCPDYDTYAYYYLADLYFGVEKWKKSIKYLDEFLLDVEKIKKDRDYDKAIELLKFAKFYHKMYSNKVPFDPKPVIGISSELDEYLPSISPDNEKAFYTRKTLLPPENKPWSSGPKYMEKFFYSNKVNNVFDKGQEMPFPFNQTDNEGGATLTINNKKIFFTLCKMVKNNTYYNCDICYSELIGDQWSEIKNIGKKVNTGNFWESTPSVTSDGKTLYFVSDRSGGFGGYDIYKTTLDSNGVWGKPKNMGVRINSEGNEISPFIHTDSQTLYFSSSDYTDDDDIYHPGHMGMGGYDIFFCKIKDKKTKVKNIGYPINSEEDDLGFFVSTDGKHGYFASNKLEGVGGWDMYSFELYKEARPERVLFVKGELRDEKNNEIISDAVIEMKNAITKQVTEIPLDSATGSYAAALPFKDDYIMTVKKGGYAYDTKYFASTDTNYSLPTKVNVAIAPIEVGRSYRLNDIYFETNSSILTHSTITVIDEFIEFLNDNENIKVAIHGHTDNVGNNQSNLELSKNRAKAVYEYLVQKNIDINRLNYEGFGENKPIVSNSTEKGRARNRRTEFVITDK